MKELFAKSVFIGALRVFCGFAQFFFSFVCCFPSVDIGDGVVGDRSQFFFLPDGSNPRFHGGFIFLLQLVQF